jgi:hypothetical protein
MGQQHHPWSLWCRGRGRGHGRGVPATRETARSTRSATAIREEGTRMVEDVMEPTTPPIPVAPPSNQLALAVSPSTSTNHNTGLVAAVPSTLGSVQDAPSGVEQHGTNEDEYEDLYADFPYDQHSTPARLAKK